MNTYKTILSCAFTLSIIIPTYSIKANTWKYFTIAYWLPYTCGNKLDQDLKSKIHHDNLNKLIKNLEPEDLAKCFKQKQDVDEKIKELQPSLFSTDYWLSYTNGKQFEIDKLKKTKKIVKKRYE